MCVSADAYDDELSTRSGEAITTNVPSGARRARGQEADEVGHVAATHEDAPAVGGIADELGDPSDGLRFDLLAAGDSVHAPTFGFTADARKSPRIPIGAGDEVI